MEKEKLGQEPAFPTDYVDSKNAGMSKRFYAALLAMQGMLANPNEDIVFSDDKYFVKECYAWADKLLKQENE